MLIVPHITAQTGNLASSGSAGEDVQQDDDFVIALLFLACLGLPLSCCVSEQE